MPGECFSTYLKGHSLPTVTAVLRSQRVTHIMRLRVRSTFTFFLYFPGSALAPLKAFTSWVGTHTESHELPGGRPGEPCTATPPVLLTRPRHVLTPGHGCLASPHLHPEGRARRTCSGQLVQEGRQRGSRPRDHLGCRKPTGGTFADPEHLSFSENAPITMAQCTGCKAKRSHSCSLTNSLIYEFTQPVFTVCVTGAGLDAGIRCKPGQAGS